MRDFKRNESFITTDVHEELWSYVSNIIRAVLSISSYLSFIHKSLSKYFYQINFLQVLYVLCDHSNISIWIYESNILLRYIAEIIRCF